MRNYNSTNFRRTDTRNILSFTIYNRTCNARNKNYHTGFVFVGANIAYQGIFQALGNGVHSLILSLVRLIVVPLPLAYIISCFDFASSIIWIAFPIGEAVAFVIALIFMAHIRRKKISPIQSPVQQ